MALHVVAMIVAGVFDRFPRLKIVIGHAGEGRGAKKLAQRPSDYMKQNVYVTTSGMAWEPSIRFAQDALGKDHVLYAMDYPYQADVSEVVAMDNLSLDPADKKAFFQTNAEKLFKL